MSPPAILETVGALLGPLLDAFERIEWVQRRLFPPAAPELARTLAPHADAMALPLAELERADGPADVRFMRDRLVDVGHQAVELVRAFAKAAQSPEDPIGLYRALRRFARIQEALYPLAPALHGVSRWFLEPGHRADDGRLRRLREAALRDDVRAGVLQAGNERDARGGFSLYVPEDFEAERPMPLVVALHGGHGHGRDFIWSWLREARSRGALVLSPTSQDRTWSIMGGRDVDAEALERMVQFVQGRYPVDRERVLLTGMSDGATYALVCGLRPDTPFTHLAPACGVLHPVLVARGGLAAARGRPVYLVHGALDWMFPVHTARMAREALTAAGARLVYRELDDLSHTYPREENARILDWLMGV